VPPPPPLPPPPPPQAAWKTSPATSREQSRKPASFVFFFRREPKLIPASASPAIGSHKALNGRDGLAKGRPWAAVGAVVAMVSVAGVPGAIEFGFREHCGACAGEGCTEQVRETGLVKPLTAPTLTLEVELCPGLIALGVAVVADMEKSGAGALNVATTVKLEVMVMPQVPVPEPEHAPPQPSKPLASG
jgi:hypothetical protein